MPVELVNLIGIETIGDARLNEIAGYLHRALEQTIKARKAQVDDKYRKWMDNYQGKPMEAIRTTPFYRASNFVPQLIRMHTDIMSARLIGIIFGVRPFWKPRSLLGNLEWKTLTDVSHWMDSISFGELDLPNVLDTVMFRVIKHGTVVVKAPWVTDSVYLGRPGEDKGSYKEEEVSTDGMCIRPIPFDDFFPYPITANHIDEVVIKFTRLRFTRDEVQHRMDSGHWDIAAGQAVIDSGVKEKGNEPARDTQAQQAGIMLTPDVDRPFTVMEASFNYPLEAGKPYKIVAVFNPNRAPTKDSILKMYFNPLPKKIDQYVDFRVMPREDLFYGYSFPEILEQSQEEQAQLHNARRDGNLIANIPGWKKKRYADVPNPSSEWYPGKVFELENMEDLEPLQFGVKYNSMIEEEAFLLQLAEGTSGVNAAMQGLAAGQMTGGNRKSSRGVYSSQGTLAMLAEGNKRMDIFIRRLRYRGLHQLGNLIFQSYKTFRPEGLEYQLQGEKGESIKKAFKFSEPEGYKGLFFDIGAGDASANREVDRQSLLLMAQTMAGYYQQIVQAGAALRQLKPDDPLRQIMVETLDGAKDLADRLLTAFNIGDREKLLPDVRKILEGGAVSNAGVEQAGLPGASEAVSEQGIRDLSGNLTAITGATRQ